jgi:hypothetical protein
MFAIGDLVKHKKTGTIYMILEVWHTHLYKCIGLDDYCYAQYVSDKYIEKVP